MRILFLTASLFSAAVFSDSDLHFTPSDLSIGRRSVCAVRDDKVACWGSIRDLGAMPPVLQGKTHLERRVGPGGFCFINGSEVVCRELGANNKGDRYKVYPSPSGKRLVDFRWSYSDRGQHLSVLFLCTLDGEGSLVCKNQSGNEKYEAQVKDADHFVSYHYNQTYSTSDPVGGPICLVTQSQRIVCPLGDTSLVPSEFLQWQQVKDAVETNQRLGSAFGVCAIVEDELSCTDPSLQRAIEERPVQSPVALDYYGGYLCAVDGTHHLRCFSTLGKAGAVQLPSAIASNSQVAKVVLMNYGMYQRMSGCALLQGGRVTCWEANHDYKGNLVRNGTVTYFDGARYGIPAADIGVNWANLNFYMTTAQGEVL